jgi:hypothetical protein
MGTSVRSGTARVVISQIGSDPAYGPIAKRLSLRPPETDFERGVRQFGYLLTQVMLVLVLIVFAANVFVAKPTVDSLLFAIALAVGLTPELLPAILSLTLARGAQIADLCQHTQVHPDHNQRELRQHVQHGWCPDRSGDLWIYRDSTISDPR